MSEEEAIKAAIDEAIADGAIAGIDSPHPALFRLNAEFSRLRNAFQPSSLQERGRHLVRRLARSLRMFRGA